MGNRCCGCFKGEQEGDMDETLIASNNTSDVVRAPA